MKQALHGLGVWKMADWIKTRGRGYTITEGDGLAYSYSVFDDLPQIRAACRKVHLFDADGCGSSDIYRRVSTVAVLGLK